MKAWFRHVYWQILLQILYEFSTKSQFLSLVTSAFISWRKLPPTPPDTLAQLCLFLDHFLVSDHLKISLDEETNNNHWKLGEDCMADVQKFPNQTVQVMHVYRRRYVTAHCRERDKLQHSVQWRCAEVIKQVGGE